MNISRKKRVYFVQPDFLHDRSTYLPYAAGVLTACALENETVRESCLFAGIQFLRLPVKEAVGRMEEPFAAAFSNYVWNFEYNKLLAREVKKAFPDCVIIFGGHHVSPGTKLLEEESCIDYLIHGEGEEVFPALLEALCLGETVESIPAIGYRKNGRPVANPAVFSPRTDYPSPYLTGVFDSILNENPELDFYTVLETNRGCPYGCAYCDWGSLDCRKVKMFPLERVFAELRWLSDNGIYGFGIADANFGMFERDEAITDEIIRLHNEYGVLKNFQTSYAKNSNDRIFRMTEKLSRCGMNKGVTLSYQSLSPEALKNVGRANMPPESFTRLLKEYNNAGIPAYTELILGLPGETVSSFIKGTDELLNAGQHNAVYIHNCEWLPCSGMGSEEYNREFKIETARLPLNQPHREEKEEEAPEISNIVVATSSMTREDWVKMNLYALILQCFHHGGLLLLPALWLHYEKAADFSTFYLAFEEYFMSRPESAAGKVLGYFNNKFTRASHGEESLTVTDTRFSKVTLPAEEYAFLSVITEFDRFYDEAYDFLLRFFEDGDFLRSLLDFQKRIIKLPCGEQYSVKTDFDFLTYFSDILVSSYKPLKKKKCSYKVTPERRSYSLTEYAKYVVWYGRKDSRNIYLSEIKEEENS